MALDVLAKQRNYFAPATRGPATLEASKAAERELRRECERILEGPTLFDRERP